MLAVGQGGLRREAFAEDNWRDRPQADGEQGEAGGGQEEGRRRGCSIAGHSRGTCAHGCELYLLVTFGDIMYQLFTYMDHCCLLILMLRRN